MWFVESTDGEESGFSAGISALGEGVSPRARMCGARVVTGSLRPTPFPRLEQNDIRDKTKVLS